MPNTVSSRALAAAALALPLASPLPAVADSDDLEQRLRDLESAYTELYLRDKEKDRVINEMADEIQRLGGKAPENAAAAAAAGAGAASQTVPAPAEVARQTGTAERDAHAGHDHAGHDHGDDVLAHVGGVEIIAPFIAFDGLYYTASNSGGISAITEEMDGFAALSHGHEHDDEEEHHDDDDHDEEGHDEEEEHGHSHGGGGHDHGLSEGFNLREVEVRLGARVPDVAEVTVGIAVEGGDTIEIDDAYVDSLGLPYGLGLRAGLFQSGFGIVNDQHPHDWAFADQALIYQLMFGEHGLQDVGMRLSIAPPDAPYGFNVGGEFFTGALDEGLFAGTDLGGSNSDLQPSIGVGYVGINPDFGEDNLFLQAFGGYGADQQDGETLLENADAYLNGDAWFIGAAARYSMGRLGHLGPLDLQGEYFYSRRNLDPNGTFDRVEFPNPFRAAQDGYYLQALLSPSDKFSTGLRFEQVGITNWVDLPTGANEHFGASWRLGAMAQYAFYDGIFLRAQINQGNYAVEDGGHEPLTEGFLQLVATFGPHSH